MVLRKTYAAKWFGDKLLEDQKDVDMHPLEENHVRAYWGINDLLMTLPTKLSQPEEHELMINDGVDAVKKKRDEWQKAYNALEPQLIAAQKHHVECEMIWHAHVEEAVKLGVDKDTHRLEEYK